MSVRNGIVLLLALSTLTLLVGCGSNSTPAPVAPPSGAFSDSSLNGTYVFSVSGTDVNGAAVAIVGAFVANGSGGITSGTFDINDEDLGVFTNGPIPNTSINSNSVYSVSVDGRGQATLGNSSTPFGNIALDFVLTSNSHGLVTEFDGNASGSGTLDLQAAGVTPAGSYAFSFSGADFSSGAPFATVGNFALGSGGAITSGIEDFNAGDLAFTNQSLAGLVVPGPSSTPQTTLTTPQFGTLIFDVYPIDATHLKLIEMDEFATFSGDAFSQTSTTVATGPMAFTLDGFFPFAGSTSIPASVGGFMVTDGAGNITSASTEDINNDGTTSPAPGSFTATYTAAGAGRFTLNNFSGFFGGSEYAAYPSSGGLLLLEIDESGIMAGAAFPQTPGAAFAASQGYGLNLSGVNLSNEVEVDDIAEFAANSSGATVTGLIDENFPGAGNTQFFGQALTGTFSGPDSSGRYTLAATTGSSSTAGTLNGILGLTFYAVDGTTFPFIESDSGQVATGVFVLQSAAGSSAAARPSMFMVRPLIRPRSAAQRKKK